MEEVKPKKQKTSEEEKKKNEKKKGKKSKPEEKDDDLDELLDDFSNPKQKETKKRKRAENVTKKIEKHSNHDRKLAKDVFNTKPTADEINTWSQYVMEKLPTVEELNNLSAEGQKFTIEDFKYVPLADVSGMASVFDFIQAAHHASEWLVNKLQKVGWKRNMTNYHPNAVSHATDELFKATLQCYLMAIKQMKVYQANK